MFAEETKVHTARGPLAVEGVGAAFRVAPIVARAVCLWVVAGWMLPVAGASQGTLEDYRRAEAFLTPNVRELVLNEDVSPTWVGDDDRFWYVREEFLDPGRAGSGAGEKGREWIRVDPGAPSREPAFDHDGLARALEGMTGPLDPRNLPLERVRFQEDWSYMDFRVEGKPYRCYFGAEAGAAYRCEEREVEEPVEGLSPNGRWRAFVEEYDLHLQHTQTGQVVRLTHDGTRERPYAVRILNALAMVRAQSEEPEQSAAVFWSPDSERLITYRLDTRGAERLTTVQHAPPDRIRPRAYTHFYALPQDPVLPVAEPVLFEVGSWRRTDVPMEPMVLPFMGGPSFTWLEDSSLCWTLAQDRGYTWRELRVVDGRTGEVSVPARDELEPRVAIYGSLPPRFIREGRELIWESERDGWRHLYRVDPVTGAVRNPITQGEWLVRGVLHVDEDAGVVYFSASGRELGRAAAGVRDPYFRQLYRVGLDGRDLRRLTTEDADHSASVSPSGRYLVNTFSRVDLAPVTVVRRASDGGIVLELETADISRLQATGWRAPEAFSTRARDGETEVYGVVWRPTTFDSTRTYPVIEYIYSGPHNFFVPKTFAAYRNHAQAVAELGFVVVQVDGLGTAGRGRAFHLHSHKNLGDGGIDDRMGAIRELAERYPYLDLSRGVGIFGHSAGGYDSAHALLIRPEFYTVAVSSAGNHDHELDKASWNTQWMGWPPGDHYREQSNVTLAPNLRGKLLLVHGDIDENVPVSATLQVVDALIEADLDFDMLIIPNRAHGLGDHPHFLRRRWDYFVEHLMGVEPPAGFRITTFD